MWGRHVVILESAGLRVAETMLCLQTLILAMPMLFSAQASP